MSVQTTTSRVQYTGNNSNSTPYVVPFYFFAPSDLTVVVTDSTGAETTLALTTDYTVSGTPDARGFYSNGANVVTTAAWDNTHLITITRNVTVTQPATYADNDAFPAATHEVALDRGCFINQQQDRFTSRALRVTDASPALNAIPTTGATNRIFALDSGGNAAAMTPAQAIALLSLTGTIQNQPTAFWNDATARASKVPDFTNQIGLQVSDGTIWRSTGTSAGNWSILPLVTTFANASARTAAVPQFTGQLGVQTDTKAVYFATGTSAGNWQIYNQTIVFSTGGLTRSGTAPQFVGQIGIELNSSVPNFATLYYGTATTTGSWSAVESNTLRDLNGNVLAMGATTDGQLLQRSGSSLIGVNGYALHAHKNGIDQTITQAAGETLVTFSTASIDTGSMFASNKFTPTVAGYYRIRAQISVTGVSSDFTLRIKQNGSTVIAQAQQASSAISYTPTIAAEIIVSLNGSTDYVEIYMLNDDGSHTMTVKGASNLSFFEAQRIFV